MLWQSYISRLTTQFQTWDARLNYLRTLNDRVIALTETDHDARVYPVGRVRSCVAHDTAIHSEKTFFHLFVMVASERLEHLKRTKKPVSPEIVTINGQNTCSGFSLKKSKDRVVHLIHYAIRAGILLYASRFSLKRFEGLGPSPGKMPNITAECIGLI